ncbi:MAG: NADH-quinone oxidoreductase subunit NuoH [Paludisphaera borealis]|uniref:NADH-quinone oxidoreductase subunit NuoH n=1 Tax=Paludisphaera borealis TaxID=1387353 RepID=UPI0028467640|nr:NADH-quinone oxidoreductase subunit NuoH [Paludisphaera borealis]MDR3623256.1 NADH-quinone oxidoreductase subunit NuoH [Paludisphaera borealis]
MLLVIGIVLKILIVVAISQGTVAYLILVERKVAAYAQDRIGPNRAGSEFGIPFALLQPLADGAKMLLKEDVIPKYVTKPLYILAPWIAITAAMIGFAVVPFGPVGPDQIINFQIAPNVNIGILYVFAVGSLAVYGVILAGWASNNKYAFIGALRSSAQLISYEMPLGMSILGMVLIAGSLDLSTIVDWQDRHVWGVFVQPLGFILFFVSAFAETNRLPFDLPESEQELVGGFHTEYSAMKFGMFFLGEYLHVITVSYLTVILFFGGWDLPYFLDAEQTGLISAIFKVGVLLFKVAVVILFIMWIRWTLPRFRYDQLMDLAWKSMIPLALVNLVATAAIVQLIRTYWV